MPDLPMILVSRNERRRRDCCLFSIDVHFPKMDVKFSVFTSCFESKILQPKKIASFQLISVWSPLDVKAEVRWTSPLYVKAVAVETKTTRRGAME